VTTTTAPTLTPTRTVVPFDRVPGHLPGCKHPEETERVTRWGEIVTECRSCGVVTVRQA